MDKGHYDHKRETAQKHGEATWSFQGKPSKDKEVWDFVLTRDDNTSFWLHPNWSDSKVHYGEVRQGPRELVQPPPSGIGGSGKGVYKEKKFARDDDQVRFDKNKNELKGPTRAKATAAVAV